MSEFISKLQYKTYEKGEYSDEKVRSLEETLLLINNFPWEEQRGVDIQLTGPSVTIQDEYGNYLKAALYFGGKFCLYYLDLDHHLYEYHTPELKDVCAVVTDFFNGEIDLHKFEKNVFSMGAKSHFETRLFEYTVNAFSFYVRLTFSIIMTILMSSLGIGFIFIAAPLAIKFFFIPFCVFFGLLMLYSMFMQTKYYIKSKDMLLVISSGIQSFQFRDGDEMVTYKKADISLINFGGRFSSRGTPVLNIMEINFTDGSKIKIPGMLIDPMLFETKFQNIKIQRFEKSGEIRKRVWDYAMSK
jgi:hypothetical protein